MTTTQERAGRDRRATVTALPGVRDGATREERIVALRSMLATAASGRGVAAGEPGSAQRRGGEVPEADPTRTLQTTADGAGVLPVPAPLAELLPAGGLVRGQVVGVSGAGMLLAALLASVTASGGQAVIVGHSRLSLLAAAELGAELSGIATIPEPGPDPVEIASIVVDGVDLVVLDLTGVSVTPGRARVCAGRARAAGTVLAVSGGRFPGASVMLSARIRGYRFAPGGRRIGGVRLEISASGKGFTERLTTVVADGTALRPENGFAAARPQLSAVAG